MADINLTFTIRIPAQSQSDAVKSDKPVESAKKKILDDVKQALGTLFADGMVVVVAGAGPGMPDKVLDDAQTFDEQGVGDGANLVIKPR